MLTTNNTLSNNTLSTLSNNSNQKIDQLVKENLYPSQNDLYKIVKSKYPHIKQSQVQSYLMTLPAYQLTYERHQNKYTMGSIVSYKPFSIVQIDLFDLSKYSFDYSQFKVRRKLEGIKTDHNKGYKYIFCMIDIFSRYADCIMMKNKTEEDCCKSLELILDFNKINPSVIMSDSDSSFLGRKFQAVLNKRNIRLDPVVLNNHRALGIIDRFARTLKSRFTKIFIGNGNTEWIHHLSDILFQYNNSPNRGVLNYTPTEILNSSDIQKLILELNYKKTSRNQSLRNKSDLKEGDKVRLYIENKFKKGTEPNYSNSVYTIKSKSGKNLVLNNGKRAIEHDILKIPDTNEIINPITELNKQKSISRKIHKEGLQRVSYEDLNAPREKRRASSKVQNYKELHSKGKLP